MICDECLNNPKETISPKRKQPNSTPTLVQRTIDVQSPKLQLSKTAPNAPAPPKTVTVKHQHMQAVIESLVDKVVTQTTTIAELKMSVDSMNNTITQQNTAVEKSIKVNTESMSSINKVLSETPKIVQAAIKHSYANVVKQPISKGNETPKSSMSKIGATPKTSKPTRTPTTSKPVIIGTSEKVIGKPISPNQNRRYDRSNIITTNQKAIWVSGLHRDTTDQEMETYVKDLVGGAEPDQYLVRKLVKKDRELSSYSFVSFKITCPESRINTLLDPNNWPSYSRVREFEMDKKASTGVRLNEVNAKTASKSSFKSPAATEQSKNEVTSRTEHMEIITEQRA